ncbi:MAG TPA: hypothetical protein DCX22_04320 [Dehalococcoidia bacterium]|nr:hypothetical protein [Dehalococcoidia bacterium]
MGRFDYRESHFSTGKFLLCLMISLLVICLAWAIYAIFSDILQLIPGILLCVGISALLIIVSLFLKNYNYAYQGPSFIGVFLSVVLIAGIAALIAGIGPLGSVKESILTAFKTTPLEVVQLPSTSSQVSPPNTNIPKPSGDKTAVTPSTVPAPTTPASTSAPPSSAPLIPISPIPGSNNANTGTAPAATQNPPASSSAPTVAIDALEQALHDEVNAIRQQSGLVKLQKLASLDGLARQHSQYMLEQGKISHDGFYTYRVPTIFNTINVDFVGENVLYASIDLADAQQLVDIWYQSVQHKENILNTIFRRTGIGIVIGNGLIYATQIYTD